MSSFDKEENVNDTALVARGYVLDTERARLEWGIRTLLNFAADWKIEVNQQKTEILHFEIKRMTLLLVAILHHKKYSHLIGDNFQWEIHTTTTH